MVLYDNYLKDILKQILISYKIIDTLQDQSGDLEILKKETAKINGFLNVICKKIKNSNDNSDTFVNLEKIATSYLEDYDFTREFEMIALLYSEDSARLKNIRRTILQSMIKTQLIDNINQILKK